MPSLLTRVSDRKGTSPRRRTLAPMLPQRLSSALLTLPALALHCLLQPVVTESPAGPVTLPGGPGCWCHGAGAGRGWLFPGPLAKVGRCCQRASPHRGTGFPGSCVYLVAGLGKVQLRKLGSSPSRRVLEATLEPPPGPSSVGVMCRAVRGRTWA